MITTFQQRVRREGIMLKQFPIPTPCEDPGEIVRRFEAGITTRTRMILVSHMVYLTGQVLPVAEVVALGRRHGIPVLVDGAHALSHVDFRIGDLDCDYYASSLHKWTFAPHGTGLLYVRRERIEALWPLMAAPEAKAGDIRKFEEIGTHPAANVLAVAEALMFHETIGARRKAERLVELREYWAEPLSRHERVRFHTSRAPGFAFGIALVQVEGIESRDLHTWLWKEHRILTTPIHHDEFQGLRVSPSVYTTKSELDRFVAAIEKAIADGLPA
jgi:selenocysteine lyase/cysteine desulfurase